MKKSAAILIFTLLLATVLLLTLLPGCGKQEAEPSPTVTTSAPAPAGTLSSADMQKLLADGVSAVKTATSYTFDIDMNMNMEGTGGTDPGNMTMTMTTSGKADIVAKQMQMTMEMNLGLDTLQGTELGDNVPQNVSAEMYLMTDTVYMKMNIPGMGDQWIKMPLTDEIEKQFDMDIVNQQLSPLESITDVEFIKSETVDGSDCYVIKIVPSFDQMKQYLEQNQISGASFDWSKVSAFEDLFKNLNYTVWIAKDTKLMKKMALNMNMAMTPDQFGDTSDEVENVAMTIDMTMSLRDYNAPVPITLPEEAKNAMEMPGN